MVYVDSHTHFDLCLEEGADEKDLLDGMMGAGVVKSVHINIDASGFEWSAGFARKNAERGISCSLGIHPSSRAGKKELDKLSDHVVKVLSGANKPVLFGIGETGLDYYRMRQPREMQLQSFEFQAHIAKKYGLPLIVHSRDAMEETLEVLKRIQPPVGIMHCFPGDSGDARRVLDLGFFVSFAGNLTYKNAVKLHDAAGYVPMDRVLFETDAPFLTPAPLRGKRNRPEYVVHTYRFFAELRKEPLARLADRVYDNFVSLMSSGP